MHVRLLGYGLLIGILWGIGLLGVAYSQQQPISIIYPEKKEPLNTVFSEILSGIHTSLKFSPAQLKIQKEGSEVQKWLAQQNSKVVIVLGREGFEAIRPGTPGLPMVVGAVLSPPEGLNQIKPQPITISYIPSPELLFRQLKKLFPTTQRVHVVYHEENRWLIDEAKSAAKNIGLQLEAHAAQDVQTSAPYYKMILENVQTSHDALWIQSDRTFSDEVLLPDILKKAWDYKMVVFSTNLGHVKKGVLFALYPDNYKLGIRLGEISEKVLNQQYQEPALQSLRDVKTAFNKRMAAHLGLDINRDILRQFDLVFPLEP